MINPLQIRSAVRALNNGGVIAYPTEGVWGLGCDPFDARAVNRLLQLKHRDMAKGLILVAADLAQFVPYLCALSPEQRTQLEATWPGPQTWLIPHQNSLPAWVTGGKAKVALRVSAHPMVSALCRSYGRPIISTSANPSGRPAASTALQVRRYFGDKLDYVLQGKLGGGSGPTPIRDLVTGHWLRGG
ncbi:MAG TPA: Sua5/YciO/YrdC/YwlC family protein [Spongiibacteraceae bacterium]